MEFPYCYNNDRKTPFGLNLFSEDGLFPWKQKYLNCDKIQVTCLTSPALNYIYRIFLPAPYINLFLIKWRPFTIRISLIQPIPTFLHFKNCWQTEKNGYAIERVNHQIKKLHNKRNKTHHKHHSGTKKKYSHNHTSHDWQSGRKSLKQIKHTIEINIYRKFLYSLTKKHFEKIPFTSHCTTKETGFY